MIRKTSIVVYHQIKADGLLSELRFLVYDCLYHHGPMTMKELTSKLSYIAPTSSTPRFAELRDLGVIYEVRERRCNITGRNVIEWDVTDQLPKEPDKKPTRKEMKEELLSFIVSVGKEIDEVWKDDLRQIYVLAKKLK